MWYTEVSRETHASKETIWNIWKNVREWKRWDKDIEDANIYGDFKLNAQGYVKSKGAPKSKFIIIDCREYSCFVNRTILPLCRLDFIHYLNPSGGKLVITHRIEIKGVLSFLFAKLIGRGIEKGLALSVDNLIKLANNEKQY